jgi:hypothetical protein
VELLSLHLAEAVIHLLDPTGNEVKETVVEGPLRAEAKTSGSDMIVVSERGRALEGQAHALTIARE